MAPLCGRHHLSGIFQQTSTNLPESLKKMGVKPRGVSFCFFHSILWTTGHHAPIAWRQKAGLSKAPDNVGMTEVPSWKWGVDQVISLQSRWNSSRIWITMPGIIINIYIYILYIPGFIYLDLYTRIFLQTWVADDLLHPVQCGRFVSRSEQQLKMGIASATGVSGGDVQSGPGCNNQLYLRAPTRSWPWWWYRPMGLYTSYLTGCPWKWVIYWLVVWNMNFMTFHILGIIIPTDFHIFQRGRYTTNQFISIYNP